MPFLDGFSLASAFSWLLNLAFTDVATMCLPSSCTGTSFQALSAIMLPNVVSNLSIEGQAFNFPFHQQRFINLFC